MLKEKNWDKESGARFMVAGSGITSQQHKTCYGSPYKAMGQEEFLRRQVVTLTIYTALLRIEDGHGATLVSL